MCQSLLPSLKNYISSSFALLEAVMQISMQSLCSGTAITAISCAHGLTAHESLKALPLFALFPFQAIYISDCELELNLANRSSETLTAFTSRPAAGARRGP